MAAVAHRPSNRRIGRALHVTIIGTLFLLLIILAVLAAVLLLPGDTPKPAAPSAIRISENGAGSVVQMRTGDTLEVSLDANPSTGYSWQVAAVDPTVLKQMGEQQFVPDSTALGAPGKAVLTFRAGGAGRTALELIYHRPFEQGVAPLKTFKATIEVKE